mmetsp:Transcript_14797/g.37254  ORF Transcript_14797/g.37254 Transcript_14797/m.37254 type:complete len:558 (-) Transcript_14797:822-2495(-)|eukprot:CAMPEP_0116101108 /NCGR_PEP_ID=MMETSP0327-20121206/12638_1 /TAXON_ID=44447 /ORGANISM="Pseudo-nitzschia delicatissima, Strain B596" /LENGTH=557 /DNA_ID=CAMNT_0003593055 /DNA_START=53 /DNA_END=1726 /DNA_ORIENTATION=+
MSSISVLNSSNKRFYERHSRRASLLCHPAGLELLKRYKHLRINGLHDVDEDLVSLLADAIQPVIGQTEVNISQELLKCIRENWTSSSGFSSVSGEKSEAVRGTLYQIETSGNPDIVIRLPGPREKDEEEVQLIIEVSVDSNGGEKKMGQAFDYASLIDEKNKTILLFTFHVDRRITKTRGLRISQEAFIYLDSDIEKERKMGFLWREIYEQSTDKDELEFLKRSCEGIVRCLECAILNKDCKEICSVTPQWTLVSDNVAIEGEKKVFKIFDNRHRPTFRRPWPEAWFKKNWMKSLDVSTRFEFQESETLADSKPLPTLGKPDSTKKRRHGSNTPEYTKQTPYPKGSILVIEYKFQNGTHYASRVSHFLDIAIAISGMHKCDIVHGDIRGLNMLHPHPTPLPEAEGITKSILIDFDFSGEVEKDVYPPGYSETVLDNRGKRSGAAGNKLKFEDDWNDLASVMANYDVAEAISDAREALIDAKKARKAWEELLRNIEEVNAQPVALFDDFIKEHSDLVININYRVRKQIDGIKEMKGTGSPNKKLQTPRGSIPVEQSEG